MFEAVLLLGRDVQVILHAGEGRVLAVEISRWDLSGAKLHPRDQPGKAKAANRRVEKWVASCDLLSSAICPQQLPPRDRCAERAGA